MRVYFFGGASSNTPSIQYLFAGLAVGGHGAELAL